MKPHPNPKPLEKLRIVDIVVHSFHMMACREWVSRNRVVLVNLTQAWTS